MSKKKKIIIVIAVIIILLIVIGQCGRKSGKIYDQTMQFAPIKSGSGEKIGNYGYIEITDDQFKAITGEDLKKFMAKNSRNLTDGSVKYMQIRTKSGDGIIFNTTAAGIAGKLDDKYQLSKQTGQWFIQDDGTYKYEPDTE